RSLHHTHLLERDHVTHNEVHSTHTFHNKNEVHISPLATGHPSRDKARRSQLRPLNTWHYPTNNHDLPYSHVTLPASGPATPAAAVWPVRSIGCCPGASLPRPWCWPSTWHASRVTRAARKHHFQPAHRVPNTSPGNAEQETFTKW